MAIEFKLPQVSEGVTEADVAEVNVAEGDTIQAGQVVCVVETDKAAADIDCPHAGKIAKVHVKPGDTVKIGQTLLTIEASAEAGTSKKPAAPAPKADAPKPEPKAEAAKPASKPADPPRVAETRAPAPPAAASRTEPTATATAPSPIPSTTVALAESENGDGVPVPAAPSTRRMARELGVDLHRVRGTGPGGRITPDDVQAFVRTLTSGNGAGGILTVAGPTATQALPDFQKYGDVERVAMSKLAKTAAANLSYAWQTIPHVTQHDLADVTDLEAARKEYLEKAGKNGPKVTMTAIAMKASIAALKAFPHFNSSIDLGTGEIVYKKFYNIGVAVDTEYGLLVPVIKDADRKSVLHLAAELTEIAEKARTRKLGLPDMQGGTFTITNLGGIGGTSFTPIVNSPEVAILGMSRSRWQLEVIDGQPVPRLMLPLSLSYDHRVINGADAARFVAKLVQSMSDFFRLLIET